MISPDVTHYLRLSLVAGVGVVTARQLIDACGSAQAVWQQNKQDWLAIEGVGPKLAHALADAQSDNITAQIQTRIAECEQANIHIICPEDTAWPSQLQACFDAPLLLYVQGELSCLQAQHILGMVGARKASAEGKMVTRRWASYLSK